MSRKNPTKVTGPPGKPILPPQAEAEIMDRLFTNMRISSGEIAAILEKYDVCGDESVLQTRYRKRLGQQLMASIRDESGKREVLAHGGEYVVVQCCNDQQALMYPPPRSRAASGYWTGCWPGSDGLVDAKILIRKEVVCNERIRNHKD